MLHPVCGTCVVTFVEWLQDGKRTKSCRTCGQDFELLGIEFAGLPAEVQSDQTDIYARDLPSQYHTSYVPPRKETRTPPNPFYCDSLLNRVQDGPYVDSASYLESIKNRTLEDDSTLRTPSCLSAITNHILADRPNSTALMEAQLRPNRPANVASSMNLVLAPITNDNRKSNNKRKLEDFSGYRFTKPKEARLLFPDERKKKRCLTHEQSRLPRPSLTPRNSLIYSAAVGASKMHSRKMMGLPRV